MHAYLNPIALRKAKIVCNFGLSECNRVKVLSSASHTHRVTVTERPDFKTACMMGSASYDKLCCLVTALAMSCLYTGLSLEILPC